MAHGQTREEAEDNLATAGYNGLRFTHDGDWTVTSEKWDGAVGHGPSPSLAFMDLERKVERTWYPGKLARLLKIIDSNACIVNDLVPHGHLGTQAKSDRQLVNEFLRDVANGVVKF
jgi:hypothetical protein